MSVSDNIDFKCFAVIVAGGKGLRMSSDQRKQYMVLEGIPVLVRTLQVFDRHPRVDEIILVVPEKDLAFCRDTLIRPYKISTPFHMVPGGVTRQDSVSNGLARAETLSDNHAQSLLLVHDGVRPFIRKALVDDCLDNARQTGACIPALQMTDTVKKSLDGEQIADTFDRKVLYRAQTPQVFRLDLILSAFANAEKSNFTGTDDASILEHAGIPVHLVPGDMFNIKLTTPRDLVMARFLLDRKDSGRSDDI